MKKFISLVLTLTLLTGCAVHAMASPDDNTFIHTVQDVKVQVSYTLPTEAKPELIINFEILENTSNRDILVRIAQVSDFEYDIEETQYYNLGDYEALNVENFYEDVFEVGVEVISKAQSDEFFVADQIVNKLGE